MDEFDGIASVQIGPVLYVYTNDGQMFQVIDGQHYNMSRKERVMLMTFMQFPELISYEGPV